MVKVLTRPQSRQNYSSPYVSTSYYAGADRLVGDQVVRRTNGGVPQQRAAQRRRNGGVPQLRYGYGTPLTNAQRKALGKMAVSAATRAAMEAAYQLGMPRPLQLIVEGAQYLGGFIANRNHNYKMPDAGWKVTGMCANPQPPNIYDDWSSGGGNNGRWANICLSGQATGVVSPPQTYPTVQAEAIWGRFYVADSLGTIKMQHLINYATQFTGTTNPVRFHHPGALKPMLNPNFHRAVELEVQPQLARPTARHNRTHQILEVTVASRGARLPPPAAFARTARSSPPPKGTKEVKTKGLKIAVAVAGLLDRISEGAEVIDAIYQALPKDVRKRWEKGRDLDRQGDAMGQYGIAGADWKFQAIWHNVLKIDPNKALKNILLNELSDKLYGAAHKARGDLTGRGRKRNRKPF